MPVEDQIEEQGLTGNPYQDGLIFGTRWLGPITFSFPTSGAQYLPGYGNGEPLTGFEPVSPLVADAVRAIMVGAVTDRPNLSNYGSFGSLIAMDIAETTPADGDFRFAVSSIPDTAYAYLPGGSDDGEDGDTWFGTANAGIPYSDFQAPYLGGYAWFSTLHELGHAFGLKHADESDGPSEAPVPADRDAVEFTIMSYRSFVGASLGNDYVGYTVDAYDYPSTLMMEDIRVLQTMYGADYSAAAHNGDTRYSWNAATGMMSISDGGGVSYGTGQRGGGPDATQAEMNRIFMTIWDGGGTDTYDLSNYTTDLRVDLQPGHWSVLSAAQLADLDLLHPGTVFAQGNVYNAYDFENDGRGLIENAIGGSGNDSITGNAADNRLEGGLGNDSFDGGDGDDMLIGGAGADALYGGDGIDTASYAGAAAAVTVIAGIGYAGEAAGDVLILVENLIGSGFADYLGGDNLANGIDAGAGNDTVLGFGGNDTIQAGAGSDIVYGMDGDDEINDAGAGVDLLFGDAGNDSIRGSNDNAPGDVGDYIAGGDGNDFLLGSRGGDTIFGDLFDNAGIAGSGDDFISGFLGNDLIYGGNGNDTLIGGVGFDVIYGGDGNDLITDVEGTVGDFTGNVFIGGAGDDTLEGNVGGDYLVGGTGADLFRFSSADFGGPDQIADFEVGIDRIGIRPAGFPFPEAITVEDLLASLVTVGTSTVLVLGPNNTVEFIGVAQASFSAGDFMIV